MLHANIQKYGGREKPEARFFGFSPGMVSEMQLFLSVFAAWRKVRFHAGLERGENRCLVF